MQGDYERGGRVEVSDAGEQASGRGGVKALGGLVEKQDVCPPEQALRDTEAAALAAREGRPAGADLGVEPRREGGDCVVERGRRKGPPELGLADGRIGELEVVANGSVEDVRVLGNVDARRALPADGSQKGRLAAPGGAGEEHGVAASQLDLDGQHPRVRCGLGPVGERLGQAGGGGARSSQRRDGARQAYDGLEGHHRDKAEGHEGGHR